MAGYGRRDPSGWDVAMQGMNFMNNAMRTGQAIGEQRYQTAERDGINQAYEHITAKLGNQGDISQLDGDPILNTRHGTMAMGQFMQQRANTETSRLQMLKAMEAADDQFYQKTFRPMAFAAQEAFKAGDMQRFSGIASELAAKSPMPYRLIAGQDGNFDVEFRSDAAGGWTRTNQRLTPQQAMAEIDGILSGEQQILSGANMQVRTVNPRFLAASSRYKMGTILGNAEAMADPKKWITLTKGGQNISVIPQNRHDDYSAAPSYRIVDEKGGMSGMVGSLDDLLSQGWTRADVKADIQNKQRIAAGKGTGGVSGVAGGLGTKDVHVAILEAGYGYDSTNKWYYKITVDEDGKAKTDLSQPLSREFYQEIVAKSKATSQGANKGDAMDIRNPSQQTAAERPAPPNIPQQQAPSAPPVQGAPGSFEAENAGEVVRVSTFPEKWMLIGKDGVGVPISPEDARMRIAESEKADREAKANQKPVKKSYKDMTNEERMVYDATGKYPDELSYEQYNKMKYGGTNVTY